MKRIVLLVLPSAMSLLASTAARSRTRAAELATPPVGPHGYDVWPGEPPGEIGNIREENTTEKF